MESAVRHTGSSPIASISRPTVAVRRDVRLDPKNGLDSFRAGCRVEFERGVEISMVGDRDRGHSEFLHPLDEPLDPVSTIEQRVLAVEMKVDEISRVIRLLPDGGGLPAGLAGLRFRVIDLLSHHHSILRTMRPC